MADFGHLLQESLAASGQAQIDQGRALALIGDTAVDKALQLARGAVDLLRASGEQQLQAKLDDVESSVLMARNGLLPDQVQPIARGLADRLLHVTPQEAARNLAYSGGKC
ncbi:hypothetical protein [Malikia spinosa]|uniref:Uncharacterized protein n=1 Tax=Malikia spinosa TaxID=86180 RepID=A0A7C9IXV2_9BURK|nr:hypothetical protein [Malikia spinosa]MYZ51687.1 hypothetical protein [Malikia spinosa]